eukprot:TRINITY_DN2096_c0_g1_i2.p1 TRINITY_DN2096_c0_g1~~TRINITY_DN2096_c0_g1_i2.p1  ORF type:complete len:135 (-),score=23.86 TRINITY_DN2096_c0_g1_i2:577-981(-)
MTRRPPRSTLSSSSAASDVYKRQVSTQSTGFSTAAMAMAASALDVVLASLDASTGEPIGDCLEPATAKMLASHTKITAQIREAEVADQQLSSRLETLRAEILSQQQETEVYLCSLSVVSHGLAGGRGFHRREKR